MSRPAIPATLWPALSVAFDEAMSWAPETWPQQLAALRERDAELAAHLQRLLQAHQGQAQLPDSPISLMSQALQGQVGALTAGQCIGPYRLLRPLGEGGMASVWEAEQLSGVRRVVALKLPRRPLEGRELQSRHFEHERDLLAALEHPGIARLYDAGLGEGGQPYLAMERVDGLSLLAYVQTLPLRARLILFLQVLEAVRFAHARLVVHGDIKPANLRVSREGHVKLLDFGIARLLAPQVGEGGDLPPSQAGALTPACAAPEQLAGQALTVAVDVYALGLVLHEILSGQRPYQLRADSREAMARELQALHPQPPSAAAPAEAGAALRGELDAIVLKARAVDPAARYASVEALAADLHRWLDGRAVQAHPDNWRYRLRCWWRQRRGPALAAGAVLLALLLGLALALWHAGQARQQARRAQLASQELLDLFRTLDPRKADAAQPAAAMRALLRQRLDRIEQQLPSDPEAADALMRLTATIYDYLGEAARSRALKLRRWQACQADRPQAVSCFEAGMALVWPTLALGQHREAQALLQTLDQRLPARGMLRAEWWLAQADWLAADGAGAEPRRQALEQARERYQRDAPQDSGHVSALTALAALQREAGQRDAALALLLQAQQLLARSEPYIVLDHVRLLLQLGALQRERGAAAESLAAAEQAWQRLQAGLGAQAVLARQPLRELRALAGAGCGDAALRERAHALLDELPPPGPASDSATQAAARAARLACAVASPR